jgi:alpha-tubulin suppressor-like RCC1 family protein
MAANTSFAQQRCLQGIDSFGHAKTAQRGWLRIGVCLPEPQVGTDTDWVAVSCGNRHTIARKADGRLFSWGDNEYGQVAQPVTWLPHPMVGEANWGLP